MKHTCSFFDYLTLICQKAKKNNVSNILFFSKKTLTSTEACARKKVDPFLQKNIFKKETCFESTLYCGLSHFILRSMPYNGVQTLRDSVGKKRTPCRACTNKKHLLTRQQNNWFLEEEEEEEKHSSRTGPW